MQMSPDVQQATDVHFFYTTAQYERQHRDDNTEYNREHGKFITMHLISTYYFFINVGGQDVIKFLFQHQANKLIVINSQNIWKRLTQTKVNKHMDDLQLLAFLKMMFLTGA